MAGEPAEFVHLIENAPPIVAKEWAARHDLGDVTAPKIKSGSLTRSQHARTWPHSPEAVDRIRYGLTSQGGHTAEDRLLTTRIIDVEHTYEGTNDTLQVVFEDGSYGYFKSVAAVHRDYARMYGHSERSEGALHEVAAWRIARTMGEPWARIVPACVLREVDTSAALGGGRPELGSLAADVNGFAFPTVSSEAEHRAAMFDALIGNQDRHAGNYLGHRTDGVTPDIGLIDHGYSFAVRGDRLNAATFVDAYAGAQLDQRDRDALAAVVSSPDLGGVRDLIRPDRAAELHARALEMLRTGRILPLEGGTGSAGLVAGGAVAPSWPATSTTTGRTT